MSDVVVTTDEKGFRNTGVLSPSAVLDQKIVTVGDSFTWGSEVSDHQTYPAHLQDILKIPVANATYGGWGTDQIWFRAQQLAASHKPSLIILSPRTNDVLRNAYRRDGRAFKPYYDLLDGKLVLRNVPVPRNSSRAQDNRLVAEILARELRERRYLD